MEQKPEDTESRNASEREETERWERLTQEKDPSVFRPLEEWTEEDGDVLWWRLTDGQVTEPPWVGSPLTDDFVDDYYTHWSSILVPGTTAQASELESLRQRVKKLEAECAQISGEFGLPPTIRPAEGEITRLIASLRQLRVENHQLRVERSVLGDERDLLRTRVNNEHNALALVDKLHEDIRQLTAERDQLKAQVAKLEDLYDAQAEDNESTTERGFALKTLTDNHGNEFTVQKSSSATDDFVWIGVSDPRVHVGPPWQPFEMPANALIHSRAHLTREQARKVSKVLMRFAETGEL